MSKESIQKEAIFLGNSLKVIQGFPDIVKQRIGYEIHRLQCGEAPTNFKPVKTVGAGVFELIVDAEQSWFRALYVTKIKDGVYILHAFEKKQNQTPSNALKVGRSVYSDLVRSQKEEKK